MQTAILASILLVCLQTEAAALNENDLIVRGCADVVMQRSTFHSGLCLGAAEIISEIWDGAKGENWPIFGEICAPRNLTSTDVVRAMNTYSDHLATLKPTTALFAEALRLAYPCR